MKNPFEGQSFYENKETDVSANEGEPDKKSKPEVMTENTEVDPRELKEVVKTAAEARTFIEGLQDTYNEFHIIAGEEAVAVRSADELTDALFEEIKEQADSVLVRVPIE